MTKRYAVFFLLFLFLLPGILVYSQQMVKIKKREFRKDKSEAFKQAWKAVKTANDYFEEGLGTYREAREYYHKAYEYNSENAALNYMLGVCYLMVDDKFKSIDYFRIAYQLDHEVSDDIHYMLGRAYHLVHDFDNAITEYREYRENLDPRLVVTKGPEIDFLIRQCRNGQTLVADPKRVVINNPGQEINSVYDDYNPVFAGNDSLMYFTTRRQYSEKSKRNPIDNKFYEDIYYSELKKDQWQRARRLDKPVNKRKNKRNNAILDLSPDNTRMYIYLGKDEGDIYYCDYTNDRWTAPNSLSGKINSKYRETSLCLNSEGDVMYFVSSNEKDNYGGTDIFMSKKNHRGKWEKPVNLGATINTVHDEASVSLSSNDSVLYFSSKGHNSMGGYDIFKSVMSEVGLWTKPVNVGYPINTPDDDLFFKMMPGEKIAYYSTIREAGIGGKDIYKIIFLGSEKEMLVSDDEVTIAATTEPFDKIYFRMPEKLDVDTAILMRGIISDSENGDPVLAKIELIDVDYSRTVSTAISDKEGNYKIRIPDSKSYGVEIIAKGYLLHLDVVDATGYTFDEVLIRDFVLDRVEVGAKVILENIFFETGKSTLKPESYATLDNVVKLLESNETVRLEISGHTDNVGSLRMNTKLSQDRAESVVEYIISQGIDASRLEFKGYAYTQPIAPNDTPQGRAKNRRVEFKVLSK